MARTRTLPLRALALAAIVAAGAGLALWGGYEFGPQLFPAGPSERAAEGFGKNPLALQVLAEPRPMPALAFVDRDGRPLTLGAFRGRVVLLNIWATWCAPCRREMPALNHLEKTLGGRDFTVLPLSVDHDGAPAVERFYRQLGLTRLGVYIDASARAAGALALPGLPTSFLIDAEGREVARKIGPAAWDDPQMTALIRRYLPPERQKAGP